MRPVLIWVQKDGEAEVKAAFTQTLAVRKLGPAIPAADKALESASAEACAGVRSLRSWDMSPAVPGVIDDREIDDCCV